MKKLLADKYYLDELYDSVFVKTSERISLFFERVMDQKLIGGVVNGVGGGIRGFHKVLSGVQTGSTGFYLLLMGLGIGIFLILNIGSDILQKIQF